MMNSEAMERLRAAVERAQRDQNSARAIKRLGVGILTCLGISHKEAEEFFERFVVGRSSIPDIASLLRLEEELSNWVRSRTAERQFEAQMQARVTIMADQVMGMLGDAQSGESVLDLGCGSGHLADLLSERGLTVTCADKIDWRRTAHNLPFVEVIDNTVMAEAASFDYVLAATVLHHSDDYRRLYKEAWKMCRKRFVLIESIVGFGPGDSSQLKRDCAFWVDWFYNNCLHRLEKGRIDVPLNLQTSARWRQIGRQVTGSMPRIIDFGYDQNLNPEHHIGIVNVKG